MNIIKARRIWVTGLILLSAVCMAFPHLSDKVVTVRGQVQETEGEQAPIAGARVTVFNQDRTLFREVRTDDDGRYRVEIPAGRYRVGVSAVRGAMSYEYQEAEVLIKKEDYEVNFQLGVDAELGRWAVVGSTAPEDLAGTGSATLLPDGTIFYCHDTLSPLIFDPVRQTSTKAPSSSSRQGCHGPGLLTEGLALFVGGGGSPQGAVATVKGFSPLGWDENFSPLRIRRWYPGMALLADGRYLTMGGNMGGTLTATCEVLDPKTRRWSDAAPMSGPVDYPPAVLLSTGPNRGKVLRTHPRPQLFNPDTGAWEETGGFVQPNRQAPNHADHTLNLLPDGQAIAVGIRRQAGPVACEIYDPKNGQWQLGPNLNHPRMQPHSLLLPGGQLLTLGGLYTGPLPHPPVGREDALKSTEVFDPATGTWRLLADMTIFRDYHGLAVLVPDGRVLVTGGAFNDRGQPDLRIEAFEPPYLFRGVRPVIKDLSTRDLVPGGNFTLNVSFTQAVTKAVLIGTNAVTHWIDGGIPRYLELPFESSGAPLRLQVEVPKDPVTAPPGYYLLFVLVDDIPSVAEIVRILRVE